MIIAYHLAPNLIPIFEDLANQAYNTKLIKAPSPFQCPVSDQSSYSLTTLVSAFSGGLAAHTIVVFTFHKIMVTATAAKNLYRSLLLTNLSFLDDWAIYLCTKSQ